MAVIIETTDNYFIVSPDGVQLVVIHHVYIFEE